MGRHRTRHLVMCDFKKLVFSQRNTCFILSHIPYPELKDASLENILYFSFLQLVSNSFVENREFHPDCFGRCSIMVVLIKSL